MNRERLFESLERLKIVKRKRVFHTFTFIGTGFHIQLVNSGAEVRVDGLVLSTSAPAGALNVSGLPLGTHIVQVLHG